mmetsp:Transcript_10676/g.9393  ORF Transcript_10676/g.9393 Transcript_10676/m.9393 type:complete len:80 (+) Transcript_10676:22-261(+)
MMKRNQSRRKRVIISRRSLSIRKKNGQKNKLHMSCNFTEGIKILPNLGRKLILSKNKIKRNIIQNKAIKKITKGEVRLY